MPEGELKIVIVNERANVNMGSWHLLLCVFPPHTQYSRDKLPGCTITLTRIPKAQSKNKWIKKQKKQNKWVLLYFAHTPPPPPHTQSPPKILAPVVILKDEGKNETKCIFVHYQVKHSTLYKKNNNNHAINGTGPYAVLKVNYLLGISFNQTAMFSFQS